ncbi:proteinase [Neohortaea acidophila]|uniref:Proteinase n=1 Tax=Neohortaea acidophila TaxID=245834 RepID=A0A6A6Q2Z0_9PEZI|nr:proteinase [Neohortaea acidophila]KAF2486401.1 proteinase [Neohortaea acidophila]
MLSRLLQLSVLAPAVVARGIVWESSCLSEVTSLNSTLPIVCGSLAVPRDYTNNTSNETLVLPIYKIPVANGTTSKHSVLLNFGGPGNPGLSSFAANASALQLLLGGDHDVILVTPRGVGGNLDFSCSQTDAVATLHASWTTLNGNASNVAEGELWATTGLYADACKQSPGAANGDLIGTAFTARDFMQVVEALDEDGLIYYHGFSYGTVLGMTIAALFPDKIGGMVLDGNVNVYQYYRNSYVGQYLDTDKVFSLFCSTCIATPRLCALAHNQSSAELENDLLALFYKLKSHPLPVFFPDGLGGLADYTYITNQVNSALYEPTSWPGLSVLLAGLLAGNTTLVTEASLITTSNAGHDWLSGIRCGDNRVRVSEPSALNSNISATEAESPIFGSDAVSFYYTCAQWSFYAKGNFSWPPGAVRIRTASPVLLVGNLYDPVTPLVNAKSNSADLEGSVVLQNDGIGHTSVLSQASLCTARAIRAYWFNGTLPRPGTSCPVDVPAFSLDNGWETVWKELAKEVGETYYP